MNGRDLLEGVHTTSMENGSFEYLSLKLLEKQVAIKIY